LLLRGPLAPGARDIDECRVGLGDGDACEGALGVFLPEAVVRLLRELLGGAGVIGPCHRPCRFSVSRRNDRRARCR
jgi:hypothetical protein